MKMNYLFTGGYNRDKDGGIAIFAWQRETLTEIARFTDTQNPSYLAFHPTLPIVYAANELPDRSKISVFRIDPAHGRLLPINSCEAPGADLCHIALAPDGKAIYGANYTSGSLVAFALREDGRLGECLSNIRHSGSGPHPRQRTPHAHQVLFDPTGHRLIAVDLGADAIFSYRLGKKGEILMETQVKSPLPAGEGPRHMVFLPSGREACVLSEIGCKILYCTYAEESGAFSFCSGLALCEKDALPTCSGGELAFLKRTETLYASLRGIDQLVTVKIEQDGTLRKTGAFSSFGQCPRMFSFDPAEQYLFVANQESGTLHAVRLDDKTGQPEKLCCERKAAGISFVQTWKED